LKKDIKGWIIAPPLNEHMFSFLTKEGALALRLPAEARERFIKYFDT